MSQLEPLLNDRDLARLTGRARSTWQKDRLKGGPDALPYVRVGRLIRYRPKDVEDWIARNIRTSTSDQG
jgi:hypothetical protein